MAHECGHLCSTKSSSIRKSMSISNFPF
ncbi:hypothetical protein [Bradyrhizobium sp. SRL28]